MPTNPTPPVAGRYGAPMGRAAGQPDESARLYLRRARLDGGGYDTGGAYWGTGAPLWAYGDGNEWRYLRAANRAAAKRRIIDESSSTETRFYK